MQTDHRKGAHRTTPTLVDELTRRLKDNIPGKGHYFTYSELSAILATLRSVKQAEPVAWVPLMNTGFAIDARILSEEQARRNHQQSLAELARRGGVDVVEAVHLAQRQSFDFTKRRDLTEFCAALMKYAAPQLVAWKIKQGARTFYVSQEEFTRMSVDSGSMEPLYAAPQPVAAPEVTDAIVDAYLKANKEYWHLVDHDPYNKALHGVNEPHIKEATRRSLQAALAAVLPVAVPDESAWRDQYEIFRADYMRYQDGDAKMPFSELRLSLSEFINEMDAALAATTLPRLSLGRWCPPGGEG